MSGKPETPAVLIRPEDLVTAITTAVTTALAESKKPTPEQLKQLQAQNEERAANAQDVLAQKQLEKDFQKVCSHMQDRGRDSGKTAFVFVNQDFPNAPGGGKYLHCQQCGMNLVP